VRAGGAGGSVSVVAGSGVKVFMIVDGGLWIVVLFEVWLG